MNLLSTAIQASIDAGIAIMEIYSDPSMDFGVEKKADNSPLTKADKASHKIIMDALSRTGIPILSEEGADIPFAERREWTSFWLVDPLDGTKEFIKRNGEFTVNIALIESGIPVMGVIYVPVSQKLYYGSLDNGAFTAQVTDRAVTVEAARIPSDEGHTIWTVVASRSHMSQETMDYITAMEKEHGEIRTISAGSSLKICLVAEGKADIYPRFAPTMEWDTAAGHAIAKAAGLDIYKELTDKSLEYNKEDLHNPWFVVK